MISIAAHLNNILVEVDEYFCSTTRTPMIWNCREDFEFWLAGERRPEGTILRAELTLGRSGIRFFRALAPSVLVEDCFDFASVPASGAGALHICTFLFHIRTNVK